MSKKRSRAQKIKQTKVRTLGLQNSSVNQEVERVEASRADQVQVARSKVVSESSTFPPQTQKNVLNLIGYDHHLILRDLLKSLLLSLLLIAVLMGIFLYTKSN